MATTPLPTPARRAALATLAVAALTSLAGCVVAPLGAYRGGDGSYGPYVTVEPPPPRHEVVPVAPAVGYVWIGGHWAWQVNRHVWIGGRWVLPPAGRVWVPHRWHRDPRGWRASEGHWAQR